MVNYSTAASAVTVVATGLAGATAISRYVGATASGAPGSGTFAVGDFIIDQSGRIWVCTTAGSPGTWHSGADLSGSNTWGGYAQFNGGIVLFSSALAINEGSNAFMGTAVLNGITAVVVANTSVSANSRIFLTTQTPGGTPASPYVSAISAGTSFSVKSTGASDTSTVAWLIINHT